ncbi:MAG: hypothetical protein JWN52_326 [Actinomycetia bacterium]|nr:hypothetical protein [Actinomycetes bacterium]
MATLLVLSTLLGTGSFLALAFGVPGITSGLSVGIDPVGVTVVLVSAGVALVTGLLSFWVLRLYDLRLEARTSTLAHSVAATEQDVLIQKLRGDRPFDLSLTIRPGSASGQAVGAIPHSRLSDVARYWVDQRPQRLMITGSPGVGKSVRAIDLVLKLLAERGAKDPVPVRIVPMAAPAGDLDAWIVARLTETYGLTSGQAAAMVSEGLVFPVVDGLDESRDLDRLLADLGTFQRSHADLPVIATCRLGEFETVESLQTWSESAVVIEIRPEDVSTQRPYIERRTSDPGRWDPVLEMIRRAPYGPLAEALSRPWRFAQAVDVYEERDPWTRDHLRDPAELLDFAGSDEIQSRLDALSPSTEADTSLQYARDEQAVRAYTEQCLLNDIRVKGYVERGHVQADAVLDGISPLHLTQAARNLDTYRARLSTQTELAAIQADLSGLRRREATIPRLWWVTGAGTVTVIGALLVFDPQRPSLVLVISAMLLFIPGAALLQRRLRRGFAFIGLGLAASASALWTSTSPSAVLTSMTSMLATMAFGSRRAGSEDLQDRPHPLARRYWFVYLLIGTDSYEQRAKVAESRWLEAAKEPVVMPELTQAINRLLGDDYDKYLVEQDAEGLKRLHDSTLLVPTRTKARVDETLLRADGASIAISGPRGAGKSTLLRSLTESNAGFSLSISAPSDYVPKDFLVELFQQLCQKQIKEYGNAKEPFHGTTFRARRRFVRVVWNWSGFTVRATLALALLGLAIWSAYPDISPPAVHSYDFLEGKAAPAFSRAHDLWKDHRWQFALALCVPAILLFPKRRRWRGLRKRRESRLVGQARQHLALLQVERTTTWGVNASVPGGQGSLSKGESLKHLQATMPGLVGQLRDYLEAIAKAQKGPVLIAIDEVDRIGTVDQAARFVSEIKAIFGIENCFFLVSVAEEVGSLFARRAISGRSVFENAFDEIVSVDALSLTESQELLQKRVLGMTDPFVYLTYALSGGLPRELIRVTRRLIEVNNEREHKPRLTDLANHLVREELHDAVGGTRSQLALLMLSAEWGGVFDRLRTYMADFAPEAEITRLAPALEELAELDLGPLPADEAARKAVADLSSFALLGHSIVTAFEESRFDIRKVRDSTMSGSPAAYTELAAARRELSISQQSCRETLGRFRTALQLS